MRLASAMVSYRVAGALTLAIIAAHSFNFDGVGPPNLSSPYPIPWVLLIFFGVPIPLFGVLIGALFLIATRSGLRQDARPLWFRSLGLAGLAVASFAWFIAGWHYGLQYQGRQYVLSCLAISAMMVLFLCALLVVAHRRRAGYYGLGFYFVLLAWLTTYAFPYLGELP